jgi:hypothetical protein
MCVPEDTFAMWTSDQLQNARSVLCLWNNTVAEQLIETIERFGLDLHGCKNYCGETVSTSRLMEVVNAVTSGNAMEISKMSPDEAAVYIQSRVKQELSQDP